jgi:hypothetical protein
MPSTPLLGSETARTSPLICDTLEVVDTEYTIKAEMSELGHCRRSSNLTAMLEVGLSAETAVQAHDRPYVPIADIRSIANLHRFPWRLPLSFPAGSNSMERRLAAIQAVEVVEYARLTRAGEGADWQPTR